MSFKSKNKQSGVALITAVLIVSLAVVASISIAENYELNFRRTITALIAARHGHMLKELKNGQKQF